MVDNVTLELNSVMSQCTLSPAEQHSPEAGLDYSQEFGYVKTKASERKRQETTEWIERRNPTDWLNRRNEVKW